MTMAAEKQITGLTAGIVERNRQQAYNVLVESVEQSHLPQHEIASRADVSPEHLSRMLQGPRNSEIDTLSRIVFAACGAALGLTLVFPSAAETVVTGTIKSTNEAVTVQFGKEW
jgi:DNA-binding phage protein